MDTIAAVGAFLPIQQGPSVLENTRTGFESNYKFEGTYADCYNARLVLRATGLYSAITFEPIGDGKYRLLASSPYDEFFMTPGPVPSINELEIEVAQIDLAFSKKLNDLIGSQCIGAVLLICDDFKAGKYATYDDSDIMLLDGGWGDPTPGMETGAMKAVVNVASALGVSATLAKALFTNVCGRGLSAALEYHTVYMRTLTAATPGQVQASYEGAGMIWTTSEVSSFEGISAFDWFQLPSNQQFIKGPPKVTATARQKTQLYYTYTQCKQATALLYDAYGSAVLLDA
jgi:hypothetical protein